MKPIAKLAKYAMPLWIIASLALMFRAALAQDTGAVPPNPTPTSAPAAEEVPPGGCMPIGITAAGEMVFPIQCKEFIEKHRGAVAEKKSVEEKPIEAPKQPEVAPVESKPVITPLPKERVRERPCKKAVVVERRKNRRLPDYIREPPVDLEFDDFGVGLLGR
jgi:hypothetical protein